MPRKMLILGIALIVLGGVRLLTGALPAVAQGSVETPDVQAVLIPATGQVATPAATEEPALQDNAFSAVAADLTAPTLPAQSAAKKAADERAQEEATRGIPVRLIIPAIGLDAPIERAALLQVKEGGILFDQWKAPDKRAVGWHTTSARLGQIGNTVLDGHHNTDGEVFARLVELKPGDAVYIYSSEQVYSYHIANRMILPEKGMPFAQRLENARWISPSSDERVTLVTCWPYETNTHRLVLVATPDK